MRALLLTALLLAGCAAPAATELQPTSLPAEPEAYEAPPWPAIDQAILRPGVKAGAGGQTVGGHFCTTNFVFASADNRTLYLGLASHCVSGMSLGDEVPLASGAAIGTLAYCSYGTIDGTDECTDNTQDNDERDWNDFALVAIADADRALVHPAMLRYGGPTGLAAPLAPGERVRTYGNSDMRDLGHPLPDALDGRDGIVTARNEWITEVALAPASVPGDSGSGVLALDGGAVGVMKYLGPGTNGVTNLDAALAYLHENTELDVVLQTWALL